MKRNLFYLHILLLVYSLTEIFSKLAAGASFPSMKFCAFYGMVLLILFVYALGWQQIIKQIPLSTAFANKAVTTIWGTVWKTDWHPDYCRRHPAVHCGGS